MLRKYFASPQTYLVPLDKFRRGTTPPAFLVQILEVSSSAGLNQRILYYTCIYILPFQLTTVKLINGMVTGKTYKEYSYCNNYRSLLVRVARFIEKFGASYSSGTVAMIAVTVVGVV
jgi:hypothetical protein